MREKRGEKESIISGMKYGFYLWTHPMDGFWDLKYGNCGSMRSAIAILVIYFISALFKRQLTAWQFNPYWMENLNVMTELLSAVGPYAIWCLASWCVTSLMDGQGTMKDLVKATSYALVPLTCANFIGTFFSNVIVYREYMFLEIISAIGMYWTLGLIFLSVIAIHQYSVAKAIAVTVLSLLGMIVIVVLGLLLFYLIQQVVSFGMDVVKEYSLRIAE